MAKENEYSDLPYYKTPIPFSIDHSKAFLCKDKSVNL